MHNTTFPKYDHYKDSGGDWLGEIPEHWEVGLYKLYAGDSEFKNALNDSLIRILALEELAKSA
jgi:type I restriction enzyme S subunit